MLVSLVTYLLSLTLYAPPAAASVAIPDCSTGGFTLMGIPHEGPTLFQHKCCMETTEKSPFLFVGPGQSQDLQTPFIPIDADKNADSANQLGIEKYTMLTVANYLKDPQQLQSKGWLPIYSLPSGNSQLPDFVSESLWDSRNIDAKSRRLFRLRRKDTFYDGNALETSNYSFGHLKVSSSNRNFDSIDELLKSAFQNKSIASFITDPDIILMIEDVDKFRERYFSNPNKSISPTIQFARPVLKLSDDSNKQVYSVRRCQLAKESVLDTSKPKIAYKFALYTEGFIERHIIQQVSESEFFYNPKKDTRDLLNFFPADREQFMAVAGVKKLLNDPINVSSNGFDLDHTFCTRHFLRRGETDLQRSDKYQRCFFGLKADKHSIGYNRIARFDNLFERLKPGVYRHSDLELWRNLDLLRIPSGELFAYIMDDPTDNELRRFNRTKQVNTSVAALRMYYLTRGPFNSLKYIGWRKSRALSYEKLEQFSDPEDEVLDEEDEESLFDFAKGAQANVTWNFAGKEKEVSVILESDATSIVKENMLLRDYTPPKKLSQKLLDWVISTTEEQLESIKLDLSSSTFLKTKAACSHLAALKEYRKRYPNAPPIMYGDMYWPKGLHSNHTSGVCVDYRPVRNDGFLRATDIRFNLGDAQLEQAFLEGSESFDKQLSLMNDHRNDSSGTHPLITKHYDKFHTQEFIKMLWRAGASYILFADKDMDLSYPESYNKVGYVQIAGTQRIDRYHANHIHACFDQSLDKHDVQRIFMSERGLKYFKNRSIVPVAKRKYGQWPSEVRSLWDRHILPESNARLEDAKKRFIQACSTWL